MLNKGYSFWHMIQSTYLDDYEEAVSRISYGWHLKKVLEEQKKQILLLDNWDMMDECLKIEEAYLLMLKYFSEGAEDGKRDEVYGQLRRRMLVLSQKIKRQRGKKESQDLYYSKLRLVARQSRTLPYYTKKLRAIHSQGLFLDITGTQGADDSARERIVGELFDYIWVAAVFSKEEYEELDSMFFAEQFITDGERQWLASALTMSSLFFYDEKKLKFLVDLSCHENTAVACRAVVGLALAVMQHRDLLKVTCPHNLLRDKPCVSATWSMLQIFCLTISNTRHIRKQMEQNFMPLIKNIQQSVTPEQLQNLLEDDEADLPPGIDADTVRKIRANMLSMADKAGKGLDVYYSTFSKMKNGIFFQEARNWLKPFSLNSFGEDHIMNKFCAVVENDMLCDSDRYSLAYMLSSVPQTIKEMLDVISGDVVSADEPGKAADMKLHKRFDEAVSSFGFSTRPDWCLVYAQSYLQDLYRFYTIKQSNAREGNPFRMFCGNRSAADDSSLIVVDNELVYPHIDQNDLAIVATEAYNQRLYGDAVILFNLLKHKRTLKVKERLVVAFCHAMLRDYEAAADCFKSVEDEGEAFSPELKILYSSCLVNSRVHTDNGNLEHALKIYSGLYEEEIPSFPVYDYSELLMRLGNLDEAQDVLFKEDFLRPGQVRIERLLLKCLLKQGKLKQALPYCMKISSDEKADSYDFLNTGHVYFALGDNVKAVEYYRKSCGENSVKTFYLAKDDCELLRSLGVPESSISLMVDAV